MKLFQLHPCLLFYIVNGSLELHFCRPYSKLKTVCKDCFVGPKLSTDGVGKWTANYSCQIYINFITTVTQISWSHYFFQIHINSIISEQYGNIKILVSIHKWYKTYLLATVSCNKSRSWAQWFTGGDMQSRRRTIIYYFLPKYNQFLVA